MGHLSRIGSHELDLDAHTRHFFEVLRTGHYIEPVNPIAIAANVVSADGIYAHEFLVARAMTIDQLAVHITVGAAGKIARLGIYANGTNCYPGALIRDYGTVNVGSAGVKAAAADQALTKGLYWLVFVSDGTPTVARFYIGKGVLGIYSTGFSGSGHRYCCWKKGAVGSGALADPFVAAAGLGVDWTPLVAPRLKTLD